MGKKSVLVITKKFPPYGGMGVMRVLRLVRALDQAGYGVCVLTTAPPAGGSRIDRGLIEAIPERARVVRSHLLSFGGASRLVTRFIAPDKKSDWIPTIVYQGAKIIGRESVGAIIATASPFSVFVGASHLAQKTGAPLILDYRDMWFWEPGPDPGRRASANERLEAEAVGSSRLVITVMESMSEALRARYPDAWVETVYNAFDVEKLGLIGSEAPDYDSGPRVVSQVGSLPDGLIECGFFEVLDRVLDRRPRWRERFRLRFIGRQPRKLQAELARTWDRLVEFVPQAPHLEALTLMARSHGLLLFRPYPKTISGKVSEYIGMRRPILAVCDPDNDELKSALREYGPGFFADMLDPADLEAGIERFLALIMEGETPDPSPAVVERFSSPHQDRRFLGLVQKVVGG